MNRVFFGLMLYLFCASAPAELASKSPYLEMTELRAKEVEYYKTNKILYEKDRARIAEIIRSYVPTYLDVIGKRNDIKRTKKCGSKKSDEFVSYLCDYSKYLLEPTDNLLESILPSSVAQFKKFALLDHVHFAAGNESVKFQEPCDLIMNDLGKKILVTPKIGWFEKALLFSKISDGEYAGVMRHYIAIALEANVEVIVRNWEICQKYDGILADSIARLKLTQKKSLRKKLLAVANESGVSTRTAIAELFK